jgi:hypothetical protein
MSASQYLHAMLHALDVFMISVTGGEMRISVMAQDPNRSPEAH